MDFVFVIPAALRDLAENRDEVRLDGVASSARDALALLWSRYPGLRDRVVTELGEVRPHVNVFVDGESIKFSGGLAAPVRDGSEIIILPAISGG